MKTFSTSQAAKKLGLQVGTLARYIAVGKLPAPTILKVGTASLHAWTEEEIEGARKLLPKIANGRKTRYQKLREKQKAQAGVPVPHKKRKPTKKK
jgi:predicted DNA-binding transcriptional regulator AlpA